jgi:UDP-N-acetylglucosamine--N-acetylmuramyl-(pentapeptide) pyrophosphoryl-undecaprenol N-acetylglucosamine transferase
MRILVVTGASGGHIFPAVAFLERLRENASPIQALLVLPKRNFARELDNKGFAVRFISIRSIRKKSVSVLLFDIWLFLKGCAESLYYVCAFRPQAVVSFGSLSSIPLVVFSRLMGVKKIVVHEQNVIPGRAQRFAAFFAHQVAISFEETRRYVSRYSSKVVCTGNPLRRDVTRIDRSSAIKFFSLQEGVYTVLIMGGSQGSGAINKAFLKAARSLLARYRFQVIHLTGGPDYQWVKTEYGNIPVESRVFAFLESMQFALSAADVVVSRGGATSITELMAFRIPAVIVPYPYAYQHDTGALEHFLGELIGSPESREAMKTGYDAFPPIDSSGLLVKMALS